MEFTYAPDFVVSRRRKRSAQKAIDPSLGYYMTPPPQAQTVQNFDSVAPQAVSSSSGNIISTLGLPGCDSNLVTPLENSDMLQRPPKRKQQDRVDQVTVDDFLQWSVQPTKKQKTRRFVDLGDSAHRSRYPVQPKLSLPNDDDDEYLPGLSDYGEEDEDWTSDITDHRKPKPRKRKRKVESFSTRILRAAVVSGVDVDEANDMISLGGRRPLKFDAKLRLSPISGKKTATRKYRLIHPSKITMPDGPDFPLLKKLRPVDPIAAGYKPISYWQPFPLSSTPKMLEKGKDSRPSKQLSSRKGSPYIAPVQPLKLVPGLKAACEAVRLRDAQLQKRRQCKASNAPRKPIVARRPVLTQQSNSFSLQVATFASSPHTSSSVVDFTSSPRCLSVNSPPQELLSTPYSGLTRASHKSPSRQLPRPASADQAQSALPSATSIGTSHERVSSVNTSAPTAKNLQSETGTSRPLKPLTSFFPQFIETAREVKRQEELRNANNNVKSRY